MERDEIEDGYKRMGFPNALLISTNTTIPEENVYGYTFINLSNVPVEINGLMLDRYYSGIQKNPTVIPGAFNVWTPPLNAGERDTTSYAIVFQDNFYPAVTAPVHRLYVMKKQYYPIPHNHKPNHR